MKTQHPITDTAIMILTTGWTPYGYAAGSVMMEYDGECWERTGETQSKIYFDYTREEIAEKELRRHLEGAKK